MLGFWSKVTLDPWTEFRRLDPTLLPAFEQVGWQGDRLTTGEQDLELLIEFHRRWFTKDGDVPALIQDKPVHGEIALSGGNSGLRSKVHVARGIFAAEANRTVVVGYIVFWLRASLFW